jgi:hypothetical protein
VKPLIYEEALRVIENIIQAEMMLLGVKGT